MPMCPVIEVYPKHDPGRYEVEDITYGGEGFKHEPSLSSKNKTDDDFGTKKQETKQVKKQQSNMGLGAQEKEYTVIVRWQKITMVDTRIR